MADQRITQLTALPKAGVAGTDVLPIADISASQTKKVTAKDLVDAGLDLIDVSSIDIDKLDQASTTKLGTTALADDAVTAAKLAHDSSIAVQTTAPVTDNFEGRGFFNSSSGNLQIFSGADYAQVVVPTAGIGDLQVTTGKLADGAVTTTKVTALGTAAYAESSVTTAKIADGAITAVKLASGAITGSAISAGSLTGAGLASATVTYDKLQNVSATDRLLGRTSAGAGSVEEISCTAAGRALLDDADAATQRATLGLGTIATGNGTWADGSSFSGTSSGTNTGDQTITLTGDVVGTGTGTIVTSLTVGVISGGAIAADAVTTEKIIDDAVTAAKLADDSAAIVAASSPAGDGAFIGQQWFNTNNGQEFTWTGTAWTQQAGIGTINIVDSTPIVIEVSYPDAYSATLTTTLDTQVAATVFAGPETGADTAPTFRAIVPGDLPDATVSTKGIIQPGTGLAVDAGTLNHTNTVSGTTISSITFDNQGHITAATSLAASDIPALDASKITTGTFPTAFIADESITGLKIADYANAQIGETLPVADHIGQFFFNPLEGSVYLWDGNVWQPVGVTTGAIAFAGTFDASTPSGVGQVGSVTAAGAAVGLIAGSGLPAASLENSEYYLVVASGGTITTGNAPLRTLAPPDLVLSDGTAWVEVDVSAGAGAVAASNVAFSAGGDIGSTNVQGAIEEVSTECRNADNITSGTLAVARGGTGLASYTKGDLIAASGSTTLAKLPVGTNTHVLRANSSTDTGLEWGADFTGTVTTVSSATAALTVATATTTPALTLRSATTSVDGIVQLSDSTSTTSSVLAATPTAVKSAYDLAALALPKAGGTVTGDITLGTNVGIQFEGTTDDDNEIRLIGADATEDRTITLPNVTGTVVTTGDSGTVTSAMIANDTIVNADINASAAIVDTKLATIATAGKVSNSATTATSANTASAIVARDGSGNFTAGTITAALTGAASSNVLKAGDTMTGALVVPLASAATPSLTFTGDLNTGIYSPGADQVGISTGGTGRVFVQSNGNLGVGTVTATAAAGKIHSRADQNTVSSLLVLQNRDGGSDAGGGIDFVNGAVDRADDRFAYIRGLVTGAGQNSNHLAFGTNPDGSGPTERLRITSAGNVGIGTSSPSSPLTVNGKTTLVGPEDGQLEWSLGGQAWRANIVSGGKWYLYDATNAKFPLDVVTNSTCKIDINTSHLAFNTGSSERARIDSSGNVGIGTSSPAYRLDVQGGQQRILNQSSTSALEIGTGTTTNQSALIDLVGDTTYTDYGLRIIRGALGANTDSVIEHRGTGSLALSAADAGSISFYTNGINRATIGSDGILQLTSPSISQTLTASATNATFNSAVFVPITTRAAGTNCFYIYGVANNVITFIVYNNGNVINTNNSYGSISDIKLKENIVDESSQWDDIKALQVRKYNFKEETGHQTHTQIGLVAQEAELISPGLVTEAFDRDEEGNELETTTKSINYSVLYMKAVKALQEAMERIEALEARITALEA